jgi:AraC-like DNA-binding protein
LRTFDIAIWDIQLDAMPSISVALLLCTACCVLGIHLLRAAGDAKALRWFAALAFAAALQALLLSLRWDFGWSAARPPRVLLATLLPPLAWQAFSSLRQVSDRNPAALLIHVIPFALCSVVLVLWPIAIDVVILATYLVYGLAFLRLSRADESEFNLAALGGVVDLRRALSFTTVALLGSALIDAIVFLLFVTERGQSALLVVGAGNILQLMLLGAGVLFGRHAVSEDGGKPESEVEAATEVDQHVLDKISTLLTSGGLAKEPGLTLSRLARRAGLPARAVSQAINRAHGENVSQFVNDIRVAEACRLLRETRVSITQVIYDSGFQTKSNFNREFLRVTGKTPRAWRADADAVINAPRKAT